MPKYIIEVSEAPEPEGAGCLTYIFWMLVLFALVAVCSHR